MPAYEIRAEHVVIADENFDMDMLHHAIPTKLFSLTGQPAVVTPCGFSSEGLPMGVQIAGRPFEDDFLLHVARTYERLTDWHLRNPQ